MCCKLLSSTRGEVMVRSFLFVNVTINRNKLNITCLLQVDLSLVLAGNQWTSVLFEKKSSSFVVCKNWSALAFSNTFKAGYFLIGCHFGTFYFRFKVKHAHKDRIPTFSGIKNSIIPESLLAPIRWPKSQRTLGTRLLGVLNERKSGKFIAL